jgi:hypothetical protein
LAVIELRYVLALALRTSRPGTVAGWLRVPAGLTALLLALVLAAFVVTPAVTGPQFGGLAPLLSYKVTDDAGAYIALGAALAALASVITPSGRPDATLTSPSPGGLPATRSGTSAPT